MGAHYFTIQILKAEKICLSLKKKMFSFDFRLINSAIRCTLHYPACSLLSGALPTQSEQQNLRVQPVGDEGEELIPWS